MSWWKKPKKPAEEKSGGSQESNIIRRLATNVKIACFRVIRWLLIRIAIVVACAVATVLSFVYAPEIITAIDSSNTTLFDAHLGTDRGVIAKLHDPQYFAEQTDIISPDQKTVACISSPERRVKIDDVADIPPLFTKAIVASEDKNFFEHQGVDMGGIARAALRQASGQSSSGASTLTMQIAKELRHGVGRRTTMPEKIRDAITAIRIEREFSKPQLLLKYINMPNFGHGQYGIEAASRSYFGKSAKELKLFQVAFMAALINKPGLPDRTFANDRKAKTPEAIHDANWREVVRGTRRVLDRMSDEGFITEVEYGSALDAVDKDLRGEMIPRGTGCGANNYFLEHVRVMYKDQFPINKGGLTIPITRDDGLQEVLEQAVQMTIRTIEARYPGDLDNDQLRAGAVAVQFNGDVLAEVGNIDFTKVKYDAMADGFRQPGSTFKIITYGGLEEQLINDVLAEANPPQTLEAISAEVERRCTVLDAPIGVSLGRGRGVKMIQNFHSNNPREKQYLGQISCKEALGRSQNTAAMRAGGRAGIKHIIELTCRLGLPCEKLQPYPTTAIGASEVNPLSMAGVAAFVNGGFKVTPHFTNDVCKDGKSLLFKEEDGRFRDCDMKGEHRAPQERVLHPAVSVVMSNILQAPLNDEFGTAKSLRNGVIPGIDILGSELWKLSPKERAVRTLKFPLAEAGEIAGKTGTATNADGRTSDVWLILFVPGPNDHPEKGIVLVFWMGKDSKDHPLGNRGAKGGAGLAETGGRNWTHSAATVLAFLQKERGLLKPGNHFQPIFKDDVLLAFEASKSVVPSGSSTTPEESIIVDPSDITTAPELLEQFPKEEEIFPLVTPQGTEGIPPESDGVLKD